MKRLLLSTLLIPSLACGPGADSTSESRENLPQTAALVEVTEPPTLAELANATFEGVLEEPVGLEDGQWEGEPFVEGGASRPAVGLVEDFLLTGDLTGDGKDESVALLWTRSGGSGTFDYLAAAGRAGQAVEVLATAELGDRVKVRGGSITAGRIEIDVVQAGPQDAACCPSQMAKRSWTLQSGELVEGEPEITGTLSAAALAGPEWVLTHLGHDAMAPAEPAVTLTLEENRIAGGSGCNRYFAEITDSDEMPGGLAIGPAGSTQMMCPDEIMAVEDRFLRQLAKVNAFTFVAGKLVLQWHDGEEYGAMTFAPREPQS